MTTSWLLAVLVDFTKHWELLLVFILLNFIIGDSPKEDPPLESKEDLFMFYQKRKNQFFTWVPYAK